MMKKTLMASVISLALACAVTAVQAGDETSAGNEKQDQPAEPSNAEALRVVLDKETGQLRAATAKEAAEIRKLEGKAERTMNKEYREASGKTRVLDNGAKARVLHISQMEAVSATVDESGAITLRHGEDTTPAVKAELPEE
jgi:hypothetical protein